VPQDHKVPQGRLKVSVVPAGLLIFCNYPGIEMPGYFQMFLWNKIKRMASRPQGLTSRRGGHTADQGFIKWS
jgi:hypothetical protein